MRNKMRTHNVQIAVDEHVEHANLSSFIVFPLAAHKLLHMPQSTVLLR